MRMLNEGSFLLMNQVQFMISQESSLVQAHAQVLIVTSLGFAPSVRLHRIVCYPLPTTGVNQLPMTFLVLHAN